MLFDPHKDFRLPILDWCQTCQHQHDIPRCSPIHVLTIPNAAHFPSVTISKSKTNHIVNIVRLSLKYMKYMNCIFFLTDGKILTPAGYHQMVTLQILTMPDAAWFPWSDQGQQLDKQYWICCQEKGNSFLEIVLTHLIRKHVISY